jgi:hypothetical protein
VSFERVFVGRRCSSGCQSVGGLGADFGDCSAVGRVRTWRGWAVVRCRLWGRPLETGDSASGFAQVGGKVRFASAVRLCPHLRKSRLTAQERKYRPHDYADKFCGGSEAMLRGQRRT